MLQFCNSRKGGIVHGHSGNIWACLLNIIAYAIQQHQHRCKQGANPTNIRVWRSGVTGSAEWPLCSSFHGVWCLSQGVVEFSLCLLFAKLVSYTFLYWLPLYISNVGQSSHTCGKKHHPSTADSAALTRLLFSRWQYILMQKTQEIFLHCLM